MLRPQSDPLLRNNLVFPGGRPRFDPSHPFMQGMYSTVAYKGGHFVSLVADGQGGFINLHNPTYQPTYTGTPTGGSSQIGQTTGGFTTGASVYGTFTGSSTASATGWTSLYLLIPRVSNASAVLNRFQTTAVAQLVIASLVPGLTSNGSPHASGITLT